MQQLDKMFDLSVINPTYITGKIYGFIKNNNSAALIQYIKDDWRSRKGTETNIFVIAVEPQSDCEFLDVCVAYIEEFVANEITFEDGQYLVSINFSEVSEVSE